MREVVCMLIPIFVVRMPGGKKAFKYGQFYFFTFICLGLSSRHTVCLRSVKNLHCKSKLYMYRKFRFNTNFA